MVMVVTNGIHVSNLLRTSVVNIGVRCLTLIPTMRNTPYSEDRGADRRCQVIQQSTFLQRRILSSESPHDEERHISHQYGHIDLSGSATFAEKVFYSKLLFDQRFLIPYTCADPYYLPIYLGDASYDGLTVG